MDSSSALSWKKLVPYQSSLKKPGNKQQTLYLQACSYYLHIILDTLPQL